MTIENLYQNLRHTYNLYSNKYIIANPLFEMSPNRKILTWRNYQSRESFYYYEDYFQWVTDNLQYSIAIDDRALVQIFFEENGGKIIRGSLSFLPQPDLLMPPFRFDLDTKNNKSYYHNSYHINFGYRSDDIRFTLNKFPYPSEFLKFCLFLNGCSEFSCFSKRKFFKDLSSLGESYSHVFDFNVA